MIIVTVGTQLPFNRLIKAMDEVAPNFSEGFFAQIGSGSYTPRFMEHCRDVEAKQFDELISRSSVIVSHAGTGTILLAQRMGKPIVILPRRAALKEHRNDHQLATAEQMKGRSGVFVAFDAVDLSSAISDAKAVGFAPIVPQHREGIREAVREFIVGNSSTLDLRPGDGRRRTT